MSLQIVISILLLSTIGYAQSPILTAEIENQCRIEAKEVALKSYQNCVTGKKAEQVELLRQEYQEKANELKAEYDSKIKGIIAEPDIPLDVEKPIEVKKEIKKADLYTEPTIILKKATPEKKSVITKTKSKAATSSKSKKTVKAPVVTKTASQSIMDEMNEVTGVTESLEMVDPSLTQ